MSLELDHVFILVKPEARVATHSVLKFHRVFVVIISLDITFGSFLITFANSISEAVTNFTPYRIFAMFWGLFSIVRAFRVEKSN